MTTLIPMFDCEVISGEQHVLLVCHQPSSTAAESQRPWMTVHALDPERQLHKKCKGCSAEELGRRHSTLHLDVNPVSNLISDLDSE